MTSRDSYIYCRRRLILNIQKLIVLFMAVTALPVRMIRPDLFAYYLFIIFYNLGIVLIKNLLLRRDDPWAQRCLKLFPFFDVTAIFTLYNLGLFPLNFLIILYFLLIFNATLEVFPGELKMTVMLSVPAFLINIVILWNPGARILHEMGFTYLFQVLSIAGSILIMIMTGLLSFSYSRHNKRLIANLEKLLVEKENNLRQLYQTNAALEEKYAASYTLTLIQQYLLHEMKDPGLLEKITDVIQGVLGTTMCAIFGLNKINGGSLNLLAVSGTRDFSGLLQVINKPDGFIYQVLEKKTVANEKDVPPEELAEWQQQGIKSFFLLPLFTQEEKIGVMVAAQSQEGAFNGDQLELLQIIANQLSLALANVILHRKTQQLAWRDPLTGLYNRYYINNYLSTLEKKQGENLVLGCVIFDIDHFKQVNDHHGHLTGDQVLKRIAAILREETEKEEGWLTGRFGGEEFILLKNTGDLGHLLKTAENIRRRIGLTTFTSMKGENFSLTISGGIAAVPEQAGNIDELFIRADEALYRAKAAGRNRVVIYS